MTSTALDTWHIGDVVVTKVYESTLAHDPITMLLNITAKDLDPYRSWMAPYLGPNDEMVMSVHALCVEADGQKIVVDTCIGNSRQYKAELVANTFNGLDTTFLADMTAAGFGPDDVDTVVLTHLHMDHIGYNTIQDENGAWVPTFRNARYIMSKQDHEMWKAGFNEMPDFVADFALSYDVSIAPPVDAGQAELVEPERFQVTPSVSLIPTPGHTHDHMSVKIESRGKVALITGDALHSPLQFARPEWSNIVDIDPDKSVKSRQLLRKMATDNDALILGTHFPGKTGGYLRPDGGDLKFA